MKVNKYIVFIALSILSLPSIAICAKIEFKKNIQRNNELKNGQEIAEINATDPKKARIGNTYEVRLKKIDSQIIPFTFSSEPGAKYDIIVREDIDFIILDVDDEYYKVLLDPKSEKIAAYIGMTDLRINLEDIKDVILKSEIGETERQKIISENIRISREKQKEKQKDNAKKMKTKHPDWSDATIQHILNKSVVIGMTKDQAIASWGKPNDINRTTTVSIKREQWVYGPGTYLYFENGKLTAIQN